METFKFELSGPVEIQAENEKNAKIKADNLRGRIVGLSTPERNLAPYGEDTLRIERACD